MNLPKARYIRLLLVMGVAVIVWTVGSGFKEHISASSEETYEGLKLFSDVIELVEKNYVDPVDSKDLIQKAIHGMVQSLDPHSQFLPPEAFEELQVDTRGEFGGIGIVITMRQGVLTVISPIEGTPAYKAGIKAGDMIVKVDDAFTKDMMLWEAVRKMRGPKGTQVVLTVRRENVSAPIEFNLVRDIIPIESVKSVRLKPGYGYVWITNFQENTTQDLTDALDKLESGNLPLKGLILDLRDNPGGLLNQAIQVADLFVDDGMIVSIKGRLNKNTKEFKGHSDDVKRSYPIVLLINGGSASASEIVAGALQDHKRALILGTTSFGKGSVQTVETLRDGYGLKFTIARYYTPNGRSIQAEGIIPDLEIKHRIISDEEAEEERLLKEKDLKNHLEAEPDTFNGEAPVPDTQDDGDKPVRPHPGQDRHGPLNLDKLMTDNQVRRALEILISFDIFKSISG
jgi:carboxyl-terminal processing protease